MVSENNIHRVDCICGRNAWAIIKWDVGDMELKCTSCGNKIGLNSGIAISGQCKTSIERLR